MSKQLMRTSYRYEIAIPKEGNLNQIKKGAETSQKVHDEIDNLKKNDWKAFQAKYLDQMEKNAHSRRCQKTEKEEEDVYRARLIILKEQRRNKIKELYEEENARFYQEFYK
ncbi:hypothetical protein SNEBB_009403 [Seison nebaliae]|nr:hypothetical protein SNEBB_009403 [Seison nebaliae]